MKKEISYAEYLSDTMNAVDRQFLLQELIKIPDRHSALYTNSFGVEYYKIPIKDGIKMIFRDEEKIYISFKQIPHVRKGPKFKGDSIGFVKENAEAIYKLKTI
jgi:hypothetical protein